VTPFASARDHDLHLQRKAVTVQLRGNRGLRGEIHIAEGQSLTGFLGMKKHFLNLTSVRWEDAPTGSDPLAHLSLRIANIVWVVPEEGSLYLTSAESPTGGDGRKAELHLMGGLTLNVTLNIADELRMSDYFDSGPSFIPLRDVQIPSSTRTIDRVAVNHTAVLAIREL
jgi:hypothetical protein